MVAGTTDAVLATVEIMPDKSLEMFELPSRHEDGGVGNVVAVTDVA